MGKLWLRSQLEKVSVTTRFLPSLPSFFWVSSFLPVPFCGEVMWQSVRSFEALFHHRLLTPHAWLASAVDDSRHQLCNALSRGLRRISTQNVQFSDVFS